MSTALLGRVRRDAGDGVATPEAAVTQGRAFALAWRFVDAGLLEEAAVADLIIEACADTLRHERDSTVPAEPVASHVLAQTQRAISLATVGPLRDLASALHAANDWLGQWAHDRLQLQTALRIAELDADLPDASWIAGFAYNWETAVADEIGKWLIVVGPRPQDAWSALRYLAHSAPGSHLAEALRRYSAGLSTAERFELLKPILEDPFDQGVALEFIEAAGLPHLDPRHVVPVLVEAASNASNDEQRRRLLKLWQIFGPQGDSSRRQLLEGVWLPFARSGPTALRAALDFFALINPAPRGTQRTTVKELRAMKIENKELAKLLDRRLLEAGWIKKGRFGRRKDADERN